MLRNLRDDMLFKMYMVADMSYRDFADFWNLDHSQLQRIVQKKLELEKSNKE